MVVLAKNTAEKTPGFLRLVPGDDPGFSWLPGTLSMDPGPLTRSSGAWSLLYHEEARVAQEVAAAGSTVPAITCGQRALQFQPQAKEQRPGRQTQAEARKPPEGARVPCWDLRFGRWAPEPRWHTLSTLAELEQVCVHRPLSQDERPTRTACQRPRGCPHGAPSTQDDSRARGHSAPQTSGHAGDG